MKEEKKQPKSQKTHPVLEKAIISLIKGRPFFGYLLHKMDRTVYTENSPIQTMGVSVTNKISLVIDEQFLLNPYKGVAEMIRTVDNNDLESIKTKNPTLDDAGAQEVLNNMKDVLNKKNYTTKEKETILNPTPKDIERANADILVHECLHVICLHTSRHKKTDKTIKGDYQLSHRAANIAMDTAINQIDNIGKTVRLIGGWDINSFRDSYKTSDGSTIEEKREFEYYFDIMKNDPDIQDTINKMQQAGFGDMDSHEGFGGEEGGEVADAIVKKAVGEAKEKAKGAGSVGGDVALLIEKLMESKVNWKSLLRKFLAGGSKFIYKSTRTKRNRRRGVIDGVLYKVGFRKQYTGKIAICVDTSGSMSDEDLRRCFSEVDKINKTTNVELIVIEADSEITQVYPFDKKRKIEVKGRGGTAYQPAIDKAVELGVNGIIYMGDMDAFDTPNDPKCPFLWCVIGSKQTPPAKFGTTIYVETEE